MQTILANIQFGTLIQALLLVFSGLVVVEVVRKGIKILMSTIAGDRVNIGGRFYDRDVVDSAFLSIERYKRAGGSLDRATAKQYREWRNARARKAL